MNNIATIVKVIPIAMSIILTIPNFSPHTFLTHSTSTNVLDVTTSHQVYVSAFDQSKSVLLSAMRTLTGIESGAIFTIRARRLSDVVKATSLSAMFVIVPLVGISVLSLGLLAPD